MMPKPSTPDIIKYFSAIEDPRINRQKLHSLPDILFIVFSGVICGVDSWEDFVLFAFNKERFLRKYIRLKNGIPSKNTFHRVISSLDPEQFRSCFLQWVSDFQQELGDIIAVDGKTIRKSFDHALKKSPIHMVSAFAAEARLVLAQTKVEEKSNEITAIPKLMDMLELNGATVTIDAMGCQKAIADKIITGGGQYLLAVKGNQEKLHTAIKKHFSNRFDMEHNKYVDVSVTEETSRGRIEKRKCLATSNLDWLDIKDDWPGLQSIAMIESTREVKQKTSTEYRYYISSEKADAEKLNHTARSHWAIENSLHWVLDVVFDEDSSRVRKDHGPENMAMIKQVVLNKLKSVQRDYPRKVSLKGLRKAAGWGDETLEKILAARI